jgi:hypothetical protein
MNELKKNPYEIAEENAIVINEISAYEVTWKCKKGHTNFQTILSKGTQHGVCLRCAKHYEYQVK